MIKMNLSDKLFHAVESYNKCAFPMDLKCAEEYAITKDKFDKIFQYGLVMCRSDLVAQNITNDICGTNNNRNNCVSLCRHFLDKTDDNAYPGQVYRKKSVNAYYLYPFRLPSLVFDRSVLTEYEIEGNCNRLPLEIQIRSNISLDKAVAISIPPHPTTNPFFKKALKYDMSFSLEEYQYSNRDYMVLKYLVELSKQYYKSLPIVSAYDGTLYRENQKYDEAVKRLHIQ